MASYQKFNAFVEALAEKAHNLGSDVLKVALTNSAPTAANSVLANISEVAYTNCSARTLSVLSSAQSSGTYSLAVADLGGRGTQQRRSCLTTAGQLPPIFKDNRGTVVAAGPGSVCGSSKVTGGR